MYDYFYGAEAEQFSFYRIPKVLFTEERFRSVSAEAKVLYGLLLDRMSLSCKNGWLEKEGRVYIIFTIDEVMTALGCADQKAGKLLHELESKCRLIERKRQGLGKPNLIYVKNFVDNHVDNASGSTAPSPESRFQNRENHDSGAVKITDQESLKSRSNNTDKNNTEMSYTYDQSINLPRTDFQNFSPGADGLIDGIDRNAVEEAVKKQIDYDCLMSFKDDSVVKMVEEIKDLMVDVLCGERSVISEGKRVSEKTAKAAYRKITFDHVQYVLHSLVNYPDKISRIDRFLTTSLLNSVYTLMNSTFAGFEHDMGMKLLL